MSDYVELMEIGATYEEYSPEGERTVPLPKFWPDDRVEVRDPKSQKDKWIPGVVYDARSTVRNGFVYYAVNPDGDRDMVWVPEVEVRAAVESE